MRSARARVAGMDPLTEVQPADDHAGRQQNPEDQTLEEVAAAEGTFAALPEADQTLIQEFLFIAQNLIRSEEHTSELQSRGHLVCRLLLEKKNKVTDNQYS